MNSNQQSHQRRGLATVIAILMASLICAVGDANAAQATLIYSPATGNVKIDAAQAPGGVVTSFQLQNSQGTFVPSQYVSPGGGFGGSSEDVSTVVIGDSDATGVGFTGTHDFGNILPKNLSLNDLQTVLDVRAYSGTLGTGLQQLDLVVIAPPAAQSVAVPVSSEISLAMLTIGLLMAGTVAIRRRQQAAPVPTE